jgi:peroxiredoxin
MIPMDPQRATLISFVACTLGLLQSSMSGAVPMQAAELARIPDFALRDTRGQVVSREQFRDRVLLINFWATWCGPCRKEMPGYQTLQKKYGSRRFAVIGIALDSDSRNVEKFARELGITYTLLLDPALMMTTSGQNEWGLMGIPTTLLVDRDGTIRERIVGFERTEVVEKALKQLLEAPRASRDLPDQKEMAVLHRRGKFAKFSWPLPRTRNCERLYFSAAGSW